MRGSGVPVAETTSRYQWMPLSLGIIFGEEPAIAEPWGRLMREVGQFASFAESIHLQTTADITELDLTAIAPPSGETPWKSWSAEHANEDAPLRVVLMGRTMAGKSSLLAALSGSNLDRIGDGRQRFSRDVFLAAPSSLPNLEIVDTPGVGASDGAEDFALALKQARNADLIIWVASNDSIQESTAQVLRELAVIGKPILVVLNCRQSLDGVGRLKLLKFPERVFGDRQGLVQELRGHLAAAGVQPLDVVYLHALAATDALDVQGAAKDELHSASRLDDLVAALRREQLTHSQSRRVLRLVDGQRLQSDMLSLSLVDGAEALRSVADRSSALSEEINVRAVRVVRNGAEAMRSEISVIVGASFDWHLSLTDFGKSAQSGWNANVASLQAHLNDVLDMRSAELEVDIDNVTVAAGAEWGLIHQDQFSLHDLTSFDSMLGNRLARIGLAAVKVGGAIAGLQLGVAIGGALGLATGPAAIMTAAVGGLVGFGVGAALEPLKGLSDRLLLGKDGVLAKRRKEIGQQVVGHLDELKTIYEGAVESYIANVLDSLAVARAASIDKASHLRAVADSWSLRSGELRAEISGLDYHTTAALLRIAGRERLARSLTRATRVPGVCILAEFERTGFAESWLFPPALGETLAGGRVPNVGGEAAGALSYALSLHAAPMNIRRANRDSSVLRIEDDLPSGAVKTWSDALSAHVGKRVTLEAIGKALQ